MRKLILGIAFGLSCILTAVSGIVVFNTLGKDIGDIKRTVAGSNHWHYGNYYAVHAATTTSTGNVDYCICCNCHSVFAGTDVDNKDIGTWTPQTAPVSGGDYKREEITYYVSLDGGSGTSSLQAQYGSGLATISVPSKTGYTFGGYYDGNEGTGTKYINSNGTSARNWDIERNNTVLHAKWTANIYNLVGTVSHGTVSFYSNSDRTVSITSGSYDSTIYWRATGSTGYQTKEGQAILTTSHFSISGSTATIDVGSCSPKTYSITLNQQSGSGGTTGVTATYAAAMPSATGPSRTGYTFGGYYTSTGGSGTQYYNGSMNSSRNWDLDEDRTLYAKWTANTYTVTLNDNGGSGGSGSKTATYDSPMPTPINKPTKTGYTFQGYFDTSAATGGTQYYTSTCGSARSWNKTENTILYARWTASNYTVTLDRQDGTGGTASVTATYDSAMPSASAPSRTGYTFGGYYDATGGTGTQYYASDMSSVRSWNKATDTILYAKWTGKTYTVSFNQQPGSGGTTSTTATFGSSMPSITIPTRTGYDFGGYFTSTGGGGTKYYNADGSSARAWDIDEATTLYAYWTGKTYTVTFNRQSGSGGSGSVTATYDSAMPSATAPSRAGYTFNGYYDDSSGGTQYYTSSMESARNWDKTSNTTLYAHWTIITYSISYDWHWAEDPHTNPTSYTVETDSFTLQTNLRRNGFTFAGYTGTGLSGTTYTVTIPKGSTGDRSYTVQWTANNYSITFDVNGGGTAKAAQSYSVSDSNQTQTVAGATSNKCLAFSSWSITTQTSFQNSSVSGTTLTIPGGAYGPLVLKANWTTSHKNVVDEYYCFNCYQLTKNLNADYTDAGGHGQFMEDYACLSMRGTSNFNVTFAGSWTGGYYESAVDGVWGAFGGQNVDSDFYVKFRPDWWVDTAYGHVTNSAGVSIVGNLNAATRGCEFDGDWKSQKQACTYTMVYDYNYSAKKMRVDINMTSTQSGYAGSIIHTWYEFYGLTFGSGEPNNPIYIKNCCHWVNMSLTSITINSGTTNGFFFTNVNG